LHISPNFSKKHMLLQIHILSPISKYLIIFFNYQCKSWCCCYGTWKKCNLVGLNLIMDIMMLNLLHDVCSPLEKTLVVFLSKQNQYLWLFRFRFLRFQGLGFKDFAFKLMCESYILPFAYFINLWPLLWEHIESWSVSSPKGLLVIIVTTNEKQVC
jgi:hypothetical protein